MGINQIYLTIYIYTYYIYIYILADIPVVGQHLMYKIDKTHGLCVLLFGAFCYHSHMHHKALYHC